MAVMRLRSGTFLAPGICSTANSFGSRTSSTWGTPVAIAFSAATPLML